MIATLWAFATEWVFLVLAIFFFCASSYEIDDRDFEAASWFILGAVILAVWSYWDPLKSMIEQRGYIGAAAWILLCYIAGGILTAVAYWISLVIEVKDDYIERIKSVKDSLTRSTAFTSHPHSNAPDCLKAAGLQKAPELGEAYAKWFTINDATRGTALSHIDIDDIDTEQDEVKTLAALEKAIDKALPPKFAVYRSWIIHSAIIWPATLVWLLLMRFIKQFISRFLDMFGGALNSIGKLAFGKF